jgi:hypothetical protein
MSATPPTPIRRILLAFDAVAHSPTALESVVALAARLDAELLGLFIEDINLLRFAGLPFAREIGLTSATARPLRNPDMERALRVQAARAEAALAREAGRLKLRWSFRVARGQLVTQVVEAALETDLVAITPAEGALARVRWAGGVAGAVLHGAPLRAPLVLLYDGYPAAQRALSFAAQLAHADDNTVIVLTVAPEPAGHARLRAEAGTGLGALGAVMQAGPPVRPDHASLAAALRATRAGTLVLAANSPMLGSEAVHALLDTLDCAAVVVR